MKWYNKKKHTRERCWTKVCIPGENFLNLDIIVDPELIKSRKLEIQRNPSTGKFYRDQGCWWFENANDALYYKLKWA